MVLCIAIIAGLLCWFLRSCAEAEEPAWYDDGIWLCDGSGNSVPAITDGEHWGIRVRSGSLVSVLRIWAKWQMVSAVLMGILLSIYRHQNVTPELVVEKRAVAS